MTWTEYWNRDTPIYVSDRHKAAHYAAIARDIVAHLPGANARVVDYGCGDTLFAQRVGDACGRLYLCDSAPRVRERLAARYAGRADIRVISPEQFAGLDPGAVDLIVVNSVVQYLSAAELVRLLALAREKLGSAGRLVLADVVPRDIGPSSDAVELLKFAAASGFLLAAVAGLARSYFSSYRRIRQEAGFLQLQEGEVLRVLEEAGFAARRHTPNMGHNARRMTFVATPSR
jgi:hypothetical protein